MKNKIIAHRGVFNNIDIPENSMKAFKKALKLNYPIELDIQLTKDNILVVLHDHTLQRMTGDSRILQDQGMPRFLLPHLIRQEQGQFLKNPSKERNGRGPFGFEASPR